MQFIVDHEIYFARTIVALLEGRSLYTLIQVVWFSFKYRAGPGTVPWIDQHGRYAIRLEDIPLTTAESLVLHATVIFSTVILKIYSGLKLLSCLTCCKALLNGKTTKRIRKKRNKEIAMVTDLAVN